MVAPRPRTTLVTGSSTNPLPREPTGFTLLEVMVAILIIGVTMGTLTLAVTPHGHSVNEEGKRLAALLNLAREEAILNTTETAMELSPSAYRFTRLTADTWQPIADDETLRARTLPAGMTLRLTLEDEILPLPPFSAKEEAIGQAPPRITLWSSGEVSPFRLTIEDHRLGSSCTITVTPAGLITSE